MRVLMLVSRLNIGGTEKYILSVSKYLKSQGVKVGIAAKRGPLESSYKRSGILVHALSTHKNTVTNQLSSLSSIISKEKYEIVNAHDSGSFRSASALSRYRKVLLIATVHGTYHNRSHLLSISKVAKRVVSVSPKLSKWLIRLKVPINKIRMIPNGIDTSVFTSNSNKLIWRKVLHLPKNAQILVHVGRFSSNKYPISRKVIMAAEIIARKNPDFIAVLWGPGSHRFKLIKLAAEVNRRLGRKAIQIRSALSHIQHAYYAADVVVGTGRVAMEAMACARSVIAVGVAGYCGIVAPRQVEKIILCHFGDHGAFVPTTVERLARDINILFNHPSESKKLGEFGAKIIRRRFSITKVGSQILKLYKE